MRTVGDDHVADLVEARGGVDHPRLLEHESVAHAASPSPAPPSSRYSSAMRIAMPLVTCSSITDSG